uniref:Uncharacterized protein n=1 Tax=Anguilla anguilla TaxID=7936 RepID=A0A0E9SYD3_ANGAN
MVYWDSTRFLVCSIICLPKPVTLCEISRQGSLPTWAPVKPYTELALIFRASCLPSKTCFLNGSFSLFNSAFALFLADSRFSRISGSSPFLTELFTKWSPVGVLMKSSAERPSLSAAPFWSRVV